MNPHCTLRLFGALALFCLGCYNPVETEIRVKSDVVAEPVSAPVAEVKPEWSSEESLQSQPVQSSTESPMNDDFSDFSQLPNESPRTLSTPKRIKGPRTTHTASSTDTFGDTKSSPASAAGHSPVGKWIQKDVYNGGRNHRTTTLTFFADGRFESATEANAGTIKYQSEITGTWKLGANNSIRLDGSAISGSGNEVKSSAYSRLMQMENDGASISDGPDFPAFHRAQVTAPIAPK